MDYLRLIRIKQWLKNLFVFLPIFFAGKILDLHLLLNSIVAFFSFSFIASSIYIINDYIDIEKDKMHPEKKNRPLAAGKIRINHAIIVFLFLVLASYFMGYLIHSWGVILIISVYFVMNLAYSFKLKQIAIIDVVIIALGFLLRIYMGGFATNLPITVWAILVTFFLALVMALGKRRGELINVQLTGETRKALDGYNLQFIDIAITMVSTCFVVCYIMYTLDPVIKMNFHYYIVYTSLFALIGILRYLQLTFVYNKTESPTKVLYRDLFLQIDLAIWVVMIFILKYLN
ncbi:MULTISPECIES: decaprenyl-phosphate phosphoribosyltransferase [unclassified Apibacter]|uniref:decaprenyl-phosphate phosphoribosyltransferase n=1 Tax=unclassified Apibacter TaxID=2630820 RepID=UPI00132AF86C|nr:decaprenyl-phosphate phosphoribosyltransferase [Apibacter sp. ESL0404]MXO32689.1 decaprenyl-phosphate phosphoribosyltransferase [Apibacter sp. B2912]MXO34584.1 decaprenyl-phosphate phosphoribosyltransferase [Apibacter sp. B3883]MXO42312.1 decaprenyl-phosphate phosphoribosyltransferase [Apibacter sp. B3889]MXP03882.1 decaprenyl-phosphate phosphoribosyltransferase [Apibacter sp. B3887]MXP07882.1 decaprenyl-phosphate phosphoribosyltransferase [Apibacter sp. B3935]